MQVVIEKFLTDKSYEYENSDYKLIVYGDYIEEIGEIVLEKSQGGYPVEQMQKLNFDGGYVAFYLDKKTNTNIIFRSHQDTFSVFYTILNDVVFFSDQYYLLCQKHNKLRWNLKAVSDYLEDSWNNICKYNRTPFSEIGRLDTWYYIVLDDNSSDIVQLSWNTLRKNVVYTEDNLDEFKGKFFEILDYYLNKIHETNDRVVFSISSGIDANTLAARFAQLFPDSNAEYVTSKIDDITDESQITSYMQSILSGSIHYIPINVEQFNVIQILTDYIQWRLPPRFLNEISESIFLKSVEENCLDSLNISGMGADGLFGELGNEYKYFFDELMQQGEWAKAKNVLTAVRVSFPRRRGEVVSDAAVDREFESLKVLYKISIGHMLFRMLRKVRGAKRNYSVLKVRLPKAESNFIRNYEEALKFAKYDGADRALSISCELENIRLVMPYGGYRFQELKYACDPYIFSDKVNKACMRHAVSDLLPKKILDNLVKSGSPGVTLEKVMNMADNKQSVQKYISGHESILVDTKVLLKKVEKGFDKKDFLVLALLVMENLIKENYGIEVSL